MPKAASVLILSAALAAQCPETGGLFAGHAVGLSVDDSTGGFTAGDYYLKPAGFRSAPPIQWQPGQGPSFRIADALIAHGANPPPDIDAMSIGKDWVLADNATGQVSIPANRWAAIEFSVSRRSRGRLGSRIQREAVAGEGPGGDLFTYVLPGSALPAELVGVVERSQDSSEIDVGGGAAAPPEVDAIDDLSAFYDRPDGWPQVMAANPQFFFSVSAASIPRVPSLWWGGTPRSGATIFVMVWTNRTGLGTWSQPRVWKTFRDLGLNQTDDVDALAVDLDSQRILFSTKSAVLDQILFLYCGTDNMMPVPYTEPDGVPVSTKLGLLNTDDVDAICAMDPSIRGTGGQPRNPLFFALGTPFPALLQNPPAVNASAYRYFDRGANVEVWESYLVGWPPAGRAQPGLAALLLTPSPDQGLAWSLPLSIQARDVTPMFCGDPRRARVAIPPAWSLSTFPLGMRWVAIDNASLQFAEGHALRIRL